MSDLIFQQFESFDVRFVNDPNGKFDFGIVAKDLADVLEYSDTRTLTELVDEEYKNKCPIGVKPQGDETRIMSIIWEPGMYQALSRSNKEKAKPFQKWIYEEVLPSIRKTGKYAIKKTNAQMLLEYAQELVRLEEEQEKLKLEQLKIQSEQIEIKKDVKELVVKTNVLENNVDENNNQINGINSELERYHSPYGDYFTVMGYLRLIGFDNISVDICKKIGKKVSKLCKDLDVEVLKVKDPRFGYINSYPEYLIKQSLEQENLIGFDLN